MMYKQREYFMIKIINKHWMDDAYYILQWSEINK